MRKRICVFIGEVAQEYQMVISKSIMKRANALDYDVVFICNYGSYNEDILYAEGEKSVIHLPDCSVYDGIIVTEDVFDIDGMPDELYKVFQDTATCPIVYLRTCREGAYSVMIENTASVERITRHFTDDHGFTDICYMSGKPNCADSTERLQGYLNVMAEHGIEVTDHMIFHGDYWRYKGEEAICWFMEGRSTYPQAIICANDYMGLSVIDALRDRGIRVPEEVCVSGFDFIDEAGLSRPSLTSLEVDFGGLADRALEIIDFVNRGETVDRIQRVPAVLRKMGSCGCGNHHDYYDMLDRIHNNKNMVDDTQNIFISVTEYQETFGFDEFMAVADKYRRFMRSRKSYFCFTDASETGFDEVENDSTYTRNMMLKRVFEEEKPAQYFDVRFERKNILPDECWDKEKPNNFFVFPIHFKNVVYAYCVTEPSDKSWFDIHTQGYLMFLANAIQNSDLHQKIEHLEAIRALYQNDPLTGIYNRRGFDMIMKRRFEQAKRGVDIIGIASIDMDNLKVINDNYGHSEGDKALIALARALSSVMQEGDACARIGGDEFAAVIGITHPGRAKEFREELAAALVEESRSAGMSVNVEASVGICESAEPEAVSMFSCIQTADKRMYEEKRSRKLSRSAS